VGQNADGGALPHPILGNPDCTYKGISSILSHIIYIDLIASNACCSRIMTELVVGTHLANKNLCEGPLSQIVSQEPKHWSNHSEQRLQKSLYSVQMKMPSSSDMTIVAVLVIPHCNLKE
jgi:hypothetical protein